MATARDIVSGALRRLTLRGSGEPIPANEAQDTLAALNDMMHAWKGQSLTYEHTTMELSTTFPLEDDLHQGVKAMLAIRIADEFGGAAIVTQKIYDDAEAGQHMVAGRYWDDKASVLDKTLTRMPSQHLIGYNIDGSFDSA